MTIVQLQIFLSVADRGSFTRAAEELVLSQSAVSHAIAALERDLGGPVFERGPNRPVALSELGSTIEPHARELVRRAQRIAEEASAYVGLETGRLRLASVASFASRVLPGLLSRFRGRHPKIEVVVLEGTDSEVRDWLMTGAADVGFLAAPLDDLTVVGTVTEDRFVALLRAGHPLTSRSALRPEDIVGEPFVMSAAGCEPLIRKWFGVLSPSVEYQVRALDTLHGFVREGLGVTVVPELVVPEDTTGLVVLPIDPPAYRRVVLARGPEAEVTPAMAALIREAIPDRAAPHAA
jgi:DNA-binding transcriptional LysR family regulator